MTSGADSIKAAQEGGGKGNLFAIAPVFGKSPWTQPEKTLIYRPHEPLFGVDCGCLAAAGRLYQPEPVPEVRSVLRPHDDSAAADRFGRGPMRRSLLSNAAWGANALAAAATACGAAGGFCCTVCAIDHLPPARPPPGISTWTASPGGAIDMNSPPSNSAPSATAPSLLAPRPSSTVAPSPSRRRRVSAPMAIPRRPRAREIRRLLHLLRRLVAYLAADALVGSSPRHPRQREAGMAIPSSAGTVGYRGVSLQGARSAVAQARPAAGFVARRQRERRARRSRAAADRQRGRRRESGGAKADRPHPPASRRRRRLRSPRGRDWGSAEGSLGGVGQCDSINLVGRIS